MAWYRSTSPSVYPLDYLLGEYAGVVLDGIDPVKIGEGFGIEGRQVEEESSLSQALEQGLEVVEREERPFLLNIHLPLGLPKGGRVAPPLSIQ